MNGNPTKTMALCSVILGLLAAPGWVRAGPPTDPSTSPPYQQPVYPQVTGELPPEEAKQPAIEPMGKDRYRIGTLIVDRPAREVRFPGAVALREGTLEYLACAPRGKLYESLLRADVDPYSLQLGLLLIGLRPENNLGYQGDPSKPAGDPVNLLVSWQTAQGRVSHRAEKLVWQPGRQRTMQETSWVFSGSQFAQGVFAASVSGSVVALYNDPTAILNNPLPTGGDDTSYLAHTEVLPPVGTEVEIVLRALGGKGDRP